MRSSDGPLLVAIDRPLVDVVWSPEGYPAAAAYRDSFKHTSNDHNAWANDGAVYDPGRAERQAFSDAADLVTRCRAAIDDGGLCVLAFDTELFGHWWHEGPVFLSAFFREAQRLGLPFVHLDDAVREIAPLDAPASLPATSWGQPRTLWTWSNPVVADIVIRQRAAELRVLSVANTCGEQARLRAVRELLALQSSDWAFMESRSLSGSYPRERFDGHEQALGQALGEEALLSGGACVRNLAPFVSLAQLAEV
jgi:1,4-alpha-glucan branching enzyme